MGNLIYKTNKSHNMISKTIFATLLVAAFAAGNEPNPPNWDTERVLIFDPTDTDCQSRVDKVWFEMGHSGCDHGQWSDSRYALMFKPGDYTCNVNVGYYTHSDSGSTINAKLAEGKHVVFQPG